MNKVLETQRLILREFNELDAPYMFALNNDPYVIRYTGDDPFPSIEAARSFLRNYNEYRETGYGHWTVLMKHTGEYMGWCGLCYDAGTGETDLGFRLLKKYWNQGFATEAASACIGFAFQRAGLTKIIGRAMKKNKPSLRVLEKLGMVVEKKFTAHGGECLQYYILK